MRCRVQGAGIRAPAIIATSMPASLLARSGPAADSSRLDLARDRTKIVVDPPQQVDQDLLLLLAEARQQPAFAIERDDDHLVMSCAPFRRQRDRMTAAVVADRS